MCKGTAGGTFKRVNCAPDDIDGIKVSTESRQRAVVGF